MAIGRPLLGPLGRPLDGPVGGSALPWDPAGGGVPLGPAILGTRLTAWWGKLGALGTAGSDTVDVVDADSSGTIDTWRDLGYTTGSYARDATRDLTQATDNRRPDTSTVAGRVVGVYDATGGQTDRLQASVGLTSLVSAATGCVAVAYRPSAVTANSGTSYANDPLVIGTSQYFGIYLATSGLWVHCFDVNDESIQFVGKGVTDAVHVALLSWDSAVGDVRGYCDGLTVSTNSGFTGLGATTGTVATGAVASGAQTFQGAIYEVVVASSVTAAEETILLSYLAARWGAVLS